MPLPPRSPRSSPPEHSFRLFLLRNEHQRGLVATRQSGTLLGKRAVRVAWCDWHSCGTQKSRVGNIHEDSQRVKKQVSPAGCDVGRRKSGWLMVAKLVQWMLLSRRGERERSRSTQHLVEPLPSLNPRNRGKRGIAYKVPLLLIMSLQQPGCQVNLSIYQK